MPTPFAASAAGIDMEVADLGRALAAVVAALGPAREQVAAVGIAGMAESGAPLRAGRPVGPIIAWHDGRGEETVASLERRFGADLARWTGRRVRTVSSVAKLGWLVDHGLPTPDRWLGVPELALFLLTGAEATEHSLAARTGAYHVIERRFLPDVIAHVLGGAGGAATGSFRAVRTGRCPRWAFGVGGGGGSDDFGLPAGSRSPSPGTTTWRPLPGSAPGPDDLFNSVGTAETLVRRLDAATRRRAGAGTRPGRDAVARRRRLGRAGQRRPVRARDRRPGRLPGHRTRALDELAAAVLPGRLGDRCGGPTVALGQGIEIPVGPPAVMWLATLQALSRRTAAAAERVAGLAGPHRRLVVFGGGSRSPHLADRQRPPKSASRCCVLRSSMPRSGGRAQRRGRRRLVANSGRQPTRSVS